MPNISRYVAELQDNVETVVVYGNFSLVKKNASLPTHISNQMDKEDFVTFFLRNGIWKDLGEMGDYKVHEITAGTGKIYMCTSTDDIRYILGI